jgi:hypothetical protein
MIRRSAFHSGSADNCPFSKIYDAGNFFVFLEILAIE